MHRSIIASAIAAVFLGSPPAVAQQAPELEGAPAVFPKAPPPPPLKSPAPAPKKSAKLAAKPSPASPSHKPVQPAPAVFQAQQAATQAAAGKLKADQAKLALEADALKADQAKFAQQADVQKAEQSRLTQIAADLKAREAKLEARAADLDAQEQSLAQLRTKQEVDRAAQLAELDRLRAAPRPVLTKTTAADDAEDPSPAPAPREQETRRVIAARLDFDAALGSCTRAGEDAAFARRYSGAAYESEPSVYNNEGWELRGRMRLEDRRGYLIVNTVCEVDADGEVQHFALLR